MRGQAERVAQAAYPNNARPTRSFPHFMAGNIHPTTDERRSARRRIGRVACQI